MSAFDKVLCIVTGANVKNGHALANMKNQETLAQAKREIENLIRKQNDNC